MTVPASEPEKRVGIVIALPQEASVFGRPIPRNTVVAANGHTLLYVCGVGPDNAARGAESLLAQQVCGLISWGTAGALVSALRPAVCMLPEEILCTDGIYETDARWRSRLIGRLDSVVTVDTGVLYTSPTLIATPQHKRQLHTDTAAVAVDMESAAIAAAAHSADVPFVSVRVIVDAADMTVPAVTQDSLSDTGFPDIGQLAWALASRPGAIADVVQLARHFRRARRTLAAVVKHTGPRLLAPE